MILCVRLAAESAKQRKPASVAMHLIMAARACEDIMLPHIFGCIDSFACFWCTLYSQM